MNGKHCAIHPSTRPHGTVSDVSAAYWQHLTHNKMSQFYMCSYGFSQQGNPASLYISQCNAYEGNFSFILVLQL